MNILCIGDSITKGRVGCSYVQLLQEANPKWTFVNAGVNGEPLSNIGQRLIKTLCHRHSFHIVVLQAGYNDLLLPSFASRGYLFRKVFDWSLRKGRSPLFDAEDFELKLRMIVSEVRSISRAHIILTTIGCLNEDLSFDLNLKRRQYNEAIRRIASVHDCALADVSLSFYNELDRDNVQSYLMPSFCNTAFLDALICRFPGGAGFLSRKRSLYLTIDGCHLNRRGATIFKDEIEQQLLNFRSRVRPVA